MPDNKLDLGDVMSDPGLHAELLRIAEDVASRAAGIADELVGDQLNKYGHLTHHGESAEYGHGDLTMDTIGKDRSSRPRAHVWAKNGAAVHAEIKNSPLMQIVANDGANKNGGGPTFRPDA